MHSYLYLLTCHSHITSLHVTAFMELKSGDFSVSLKSPAENTYFHQAIKSSFNTVIINSNTTHYLAEEDSFL